MLERGELCPKKNCIYVENDLIRRLAVEVVSFVSDLIRFGIIEDLRELPSHVVITPPYHT